MIMYSVFAGLGLNVFILIHFESLSNSCCVSHRSLSTSYHICLELNRPFSSYLLTSADVFANLWDPLPTEITWLL